MELCISPRGLSGEVEAIASKSQAHRLLICAALSGESHTILCRETSQDIDATARCLAAMGHIVRREADGFSVLKGERKEAAWADCGESGSTLRFLLPVAGAMGLSTRFLLSGRLPKRPLSPLWEELEAHGVKLWWEKENVLVSEGQLAGGTYTLSGDVSSQFISGLLFALPLLEADSRLVLTGKLESAQYVEMTLDVLRRFGIRIEREGEIWHIPGRQQYQNTGGALLPVEGDWSNAAFFLAAGALGDGITLKGLSVDSLQGDKEIYRLLTAFGAQVKAEKDGICVKKAPLTALDIDAMQIPDLVPILAVIAAAATGTTRIYGAKRLRLKESDRLRTVCEMLSQLGGEIQETEDGLLITGGAPLKGGCVDSAGDHRICMAAAIASILCKEKVYIQGAEAVQKSYPGFWQQFQILGGESKEVVR